MPPPFTVRAQDQPGVDLGYWDHSGSIAIPGDLFVGGQVISGSAVIGNSLSALVSDLQNRVTALEAFVSQTGLLYQQGLAANIGPAQLGSSMYFATDTGELWIPNNGTWYKVALSAQTLTSGGANPPQNFTAVVQPDNTTVMNWTLPTPPSGYAIGAVTVREAFQSPNGVAGMPLGAAATSFTLPAITVSSTAEYYVTCTFTKSAQPNVESAQSTHVGVSYQSSTTTPPVVSTFGNQTIDGTSSASSADKMIVSKFTPTVSGTLSAAHARLWVTTAGATAKTKFIVFADSAGNPGAKVAESAEITISNTAVTVIDYTFTGANAAAITAGTPVHIGVAWQQPSSGNINWLRGGTASQTSSQPTFTYPTIPSSFGSVTALTGPIDVYVDTVATGGGGGAVLTPAQILGIGTGSYWYLTLDRAPAAGGELTPTLAQLTSGYVNSPYFYVNATGDAVCMSTVASASTTQNSPHPRTELREVKPNGDNAEWTAVSGELHSCFGTSTVTYLPPDVESSSTPKPQVCFAQIHDTDGFPSGYKGGDVVRLQVENSGSTPSDSPGGTSVSNLHIVAHTHSPNGAAATEVKTSIQSSYTLGTPINWKLEVIGTTCNIYLGGTITGTAGNWVWSGGTKVFTFTISGPGMYFKAGDYQQFSTFVTNSSGNPDGGYLPTSKAIVELKRIMVNHSSLA